MDAIVNLAVAPIGELADDNTFVGSRNQEEFLTAMKDSGARWFTECDWRIGECHELLPRLAESRCVQVLVGIESLVFRYPGFGSKRAELDRIMNAVQAIQEAGVVVNGCFIVGADGETRRSIDEMVAFILESCLGEVQLTLQTPFPGTQLYNRMRAEQRLLSDRDWSSYTLFDVSFQPDSLSVDELTIGFPGAIREVFSRESTNRRQRILQNIWRTGKALRS